MSLKILILGSEGFIGSNLTHFYCQKSYEVYGADVLEHPGFIKYKYIKVSRHSAALDDLFRQFTFDICINAAGSGNVTYSVVYPLIDFEANVLDVMIILDSIRKYQPKCKYLHISSAAVYGNPTKLPINETDNLKPVSPYGFHKMMSENICREYHQLYDLPIVILRPFSVYGPGLKKQLFWDICKKLNDTQNRSISLYGTGRESRDFIYIDDLVLLIDTIVNNALFSNDIYNAASGIETTIAEIAQEIMDILPGTEISFSGQIREGDPINWRADVEKISLLGFKSGIPFKAGLQKYLTWFNSYFHYEK